MPHRAAWHHELHDGLLPLLAWSAVRQHDDRRGKLPFGTSVLQLVGGEGLCDPEGQYGVCPNATTPCQNANG
jgi:hypothetical protein